MNANEKGKKINLESYNGCDVIINCSLRCKLLTFLTFLSQASQSCSSFCKFSRLIYIQRFLHNLIQTTWSIIQQSSKTYSLKKDTIGIKESLLIREVCPLFRGEKVWYRLTNLVRCPHLRGVLHEGFHCINHIHTTTIYCQSGHINFVSVPTIKATVTENSSCFKLPCDILMHIL